jgi:ABC-2 type transport system permease protein
VKVLVIAATNLRRFLRDRSNIFFVFVFPILLILVLGASFGGTVVPRLGVLSEDSGELAIDLTQRLDASSDIRVAGFDDRAGMVRAVERGELEAGLVIPSGFDAAIRAGGTADLEFVASSGNGSTAMRTTVESIVTRQGTVLRPPTSRPRRESPASPTVWQPPPRSRPRSPRSTSPSPPPERRSL